MSSQSHETVSGSSAGAVPQDFEVRIHARGELVQIEVVGELCLSNLDNFVVRFDDLRARGFQHVAFDLRPVTFMDSTGVRVLIDSETSALENGLSFAVIAGEGQPVRILDLAGLSERPPRMLAEDLP